VLQRVWMVVGHLPDSSCCGSKCLLVVLATTTALSAVNPSLDNAKEKRNHHQEDLVQLRGMAHVEATRGIHALDQERAIVAHNMDIVERRMLIVEGGVNRPLVIAQDPAVL
jgi:hypothetical protein